MLFKSKGEQNARHPLFQEVYKTLCNLISDLETAMCSGKSQ